MFTVYRLIDQRYSTTRYVGITDDVYVRFSQHLRCDGSNPGKDEWIQELKECQIMLIMETLQVVETLEEAKEREAYWIQHFLSEGAKLLNQQIPLGFSYDDFMAFFDSGKETKRTRYYPTSTRTTVTFEEASQITGYTVGSLKKYASQGKVKRSKRDPNLLLLSSLTGMSNKTKFQQNGHDTTVPLELVSLNGTH
jgi:predicted GIY-YIG superfamily endonuclease